MNKDEEVVMYIVVNKDLKMGKGKIAAQVGHVVMHLIQALEHMDSRSVCIDDYEMWKSHSYPKVVLKASLSELYDIKENYCDTICIQRDEGRTQIEDGSLTAIGFYPLKRKYAPKGIEELKLL